MVALPFGESPRSTSVLEIRKPRAFLHLYGGTLGTGFPMRLLEMVCILRNSRLRSIGASPQACPRLESPPPRRRSGQRGHPNSSFEASWVDVEKLGQRSAQTRSAGERCAVTPGRLLPGGILSSGSPPASFDSTGFP